MRPFQSSLIIASTALCLSSCSLIKSTYSSQAAGQAVSLKFLALMTKGSYPAAYAMLAAGTKAGVPIATLKTQGAKMNAYLGRAPATHLTGFNSMFGTSAHTDFSYYVSGTKNALTVTVEVVPQGSGWAVNSFVYQ